MDKPRPFMCYFCNKTIENDTEFGHISTCGSVLEPCANKCGSYVPRNMRGKHLRECKNKMSKSTSRLNRLSIGNDNYDTNANDSRSAYNNTATMPRIANGANIDLIELKYKIHGLEQFCNQLSQTILMTKSQHQDANQKSENSKMHLKMAFDKLQYQVKIVLEWKRGLELQMEKLNRDVDLFSKFQRETLSKLENFRSLHDSSQKIDTNIKLMQVNFHKEHLNNQELINRLQQDLNEFKDYFAQENAVIGALWNDSRIEADKLKTELNAASKTLEENKSKNTSIVFDLRAVSQISSETADKLDIQDRSLGVIQKEVAQLKLNLDALDTESNVHGTVNFPGQLLWKISKFSEKMENAKENDTMLRSPIFYTQHYGYKVRLQVFLNGIKKWKGRHLIACLHVLKGDYDLLLKWPCCIEGTLILRDLYNPVNPTNFSKYICAKRYAGDEDNEEPQESSTQYIFVPHTTLLKQNFIQEDTLFIEIKTFPSSSKKSDETEL
uniref:MATH domain-containing protein n=2 Tax=Photinus pyralis TaxID=7054 RepID=A0A1Y1JZQ4_PHOPY